jgi:leader peptidase (prepilin peptidase)/N-methyltransferase
VGPDWVFIAAAVILGAAFGSFLNVCIYRLPRGESLLHPPSTCPACGTRIAWYDNIPILGWVMLAGKCRRCGARISVQYPLIEILVAALWGCAAWGYGITWQGLSAAGFGLLYLVAWGGEKVFRKEAMGGGDIKMMAMVGAFVGWQGVLLTIFGGALLGTVIFVPISLRTKKLVPFGVFLAVGAAVSFVAGHAIVEWYRRSMLGL